MYNYQALKEELNLQIFTFPSLLALLAQGNCGEHLSSVIIRMMNANINIYLLFGNKRPKGTDKL